MNATKYLPIPIIVGILAFIWMVVSSKFGLLGWVAFLTWASYFLKGVGVKNAVREIIGYTLGILIGVVIVLIGTSSLSGVLGSYTFPILVGIAGFVIVYLEIVPWVDLGAMYFIGAAAFFAVGAKPDIATISAVWIPGVLGTLLGMVTAFLRKETFKIEGQVDPVTMKK